MTGAEGWGEGERELYALTMLNDFYRAFHSLSPLEFIRHPFLSHLAVLLQLGSTVLIILHVFHSVLTNPII